MSKAEIKIKIETLLIYLKEANDILLRLETDLHDNQKNMLKRDIIAMKNEINHYNSVWHNYNNEINNLYAQLGVINAN
jgi:hypothetical protein